MIDNRISAMKVGEVKIQYTSLVSGKAKEVIGTLKDSHMVHQSSENETIVFWDVKNKKYEDIKLTSITGWHVTWGT